MAIQADEGKVEKKVEEHKQQLAAEPALESVPDFVELEEVVEDEDDQQERETPIKDSQEGIKMKEEQEKEKQNNIDKKNINISTQERKQQTSDTVKYNNEEIFVGGSLWVQN